MKVGLRLNGLAIGIDPNDPTHSIYHDRKDVGAWEEGELTAHTGGLFDFRFIATDRQLTITPAGSLESRPAGSIGSWELLYATDQPDGSSLCYRVESGGRIPVVLTVEAH